MTKQRAFELSIIFETTGVVLKIGSSLKPNHHEPWWFCQKLWNALHLITLCKCVHTFVIPVTVCPLFTLHLAGDGGDRDVLQPHAGEGRARRQVAWQKNRDCQRRLTFCDVTCMLCSSRDVINDMSYKMNQLQRDKMKWPNQKKQLKTKCLT